MHRDLPCVCCSALGSAGPRANSPRTPCCGACQCDSCGSATTSYTISSAAAATPHAYDMRNADMIYKNYKQPIPELVFIYFHPLTLTNPSQPLPHRSDRSKLIQPRHRSDRSLRPVRPILPRPQTRIQVVAKLAHKFQIISRP